MKAHESTEEQGYIAVLTGDVVNSSKLPEAARTHLERNLWAWLTEGGEKAAKAGKVDYSPDDVDVHRGDAFQIRLREPKQALRLAIWLRACLIAWADTRELAQDGTFSSGQRLPESLGQDIKKAKLDARIAIGIGLETVAGRRVSSSDGPAYQASGHRLDAMKADKRRLAVAMEPEANNEPTPRLGDASLRHRAIETLAMLVDRLIVSEWTAVQGRVMRFLLLEPDLHQVVKAVLERKIEDSYSYAAALNAANRAHREELVEVLASWEDDQDGLTPGRHRVLFNQGLEKQMQGEWQAAVDLYTKALALKPDDTKVLFKRAYVMAAHLEDHEGALQDYSAGVELEPWNWMALTNRGACKTELGDYEGAIEDFTAALARKPDYAEALNNRGVSKAQLGDYTGAIEDYTAALAIKPDYAEALNNRGARKAELGDYTGAIEDYKAALAIKPDYAEALSNRANANAQLGALEEAMEDVEKALALEPKQPYFIGTKGYILHQKGLQKEALAHYDKCLELNPKIPEEYHERGKVHLALGNRQAALADWRRALALYPPQHPKAKEVQALLAAHDDA